MTVINLKKRPSLGWAQRAARIGIRRSRALGFVSVAMVGRFGGRGLSNIASRAVSGSGRLAIAKVNCDMARAEAKRILAEVALGRDPQCDREAERQNSTRTLIAAINAYLDVKQMQFERGQYRKASLP